MRGTTAGAPATQHSMTLTARPPSLVSLYQVLVFARGDLTAAQMGDLCLEYSDKIHRLAAARGPFVYSLATHGLARKRLAAP